MTRDEQIVQQAKEVTNRFSFRNGYSTNQDAFIEGAKWADNNPTNPWHKTSEKLPKVPEVRKYIKVFAAIHHGSGYDFRVLYFHKGFGFSKYKDYSKVYYKDQKTGCAYWMYIPEITED